MNRVKAYELWCQRDMTQLECTKIVVPELSDSNNFAIADKTKFYGDTVCGVGLTPDAKEKLTYFLGILNSHLMEYYYKKKTTVPKASGFYIYKTMFLKELRFDVLTSLINLTGIYTTS